jgi:perosamine synthetase
MTIPMAHPDIGPAEESAVLRVLRSGQLAQGGEVEALEAEFANRVGAGFAVCVSSGTAALHAALAAAGVGAGDEVITVAFTFVASVNPILMLGGTPVFVDIEQDSFLIDIRGVVDALSRRTRAIIPVHLYGQPVDVDEMRTACAGADVVIVEDSAQAIGASYRGVRVGALGDAAAFSLYATKNITAGEGGIVTTNQADVAAFVRKFRQHGMKTRYSYDGLGFNYRMTDLQAAIARSQLARLDQITARRQAIARRYTSVLSEVADIRCPEERPERRHVFHQYTIRFVDVDLRDYVRARLAESGIATDVYYPASLADIAHIRENSIQASNLPHTKDSCRSVLSLPIHTQLSDEDIDMVIESILKAVA